MDEAGFSLLAAAVSTWAPKGQTPLLNYPLGEHLSVISAMTPQGQLYTMIQDKSFSGPDIVRFLKHLLRHMAGKLLVIWDGLPAHRAQPVKDFLHNRGSQRILLEQLPAYAPELNPDEGVWNYLKNVELRNLCGHDLLELRHQLRRAIARLRHKPHIIQGFLRQARLEPVV